MASTEIPTTTPNGPDDDVFQNMTEYDVHEVPVVLLEIQDDLARSRLREALWLSVMVHLFVVMALATAPHWAYPHGMVIISPAEAMKQQEMTYLELPPDIQKLTEKPKTNILSDKDRIASSRHPELNQKELRRILDSQRQGQPSPPPGTPAAPAQQQMAQAQPQGQPQQSQGASGPQLPPSQTQPRLETPSPGGGTSSNNPFSAALSAGSAIEQAARATAGSRGTSAGPGGNFGLGTGRQGASVGSQLDILSDTQGVDFGPYLERVVYLVRMNWYNIIPEVARPPLLKKGRVSIEFAITKDGSVAGMRLVGQSGDVALDRAAWGGITASNPFPQLPSEFKGQYLALRFHFYYNPDRNDLR